MVRMPRFAVGDRVFVYKLSTKTGPYRILTLHEGGADVTLVEKPREASIRVPFERLRVCPEEIPDSSSPPQGVLITSDLSVSQTTTTSPTPSTERSVWADRLRRREKK